MRRDDVLDILEKNREMIRGFGVRSIGLFGSCARGEEGEASDLDFLVELNLLNLKAERETRPLIKGLGFYA